MSFLSVILTVAALILGLIVAIVEYMYSKNDEKDDSSDNEENPMKILEEDLLNKNDKSDY